MEICFTPSKHWGQSYIAIGVGCLLMEHKIKFYPVGNADCTLIKLSNGKTIIVDCKIKNAFDDKGNQIYYDVKTDLLHELKRDEDGHPFKDDAFFSKSLVGYVQLLIKQTKL